MRRYALASTLIGLALWLGTSLSAAPTRLPEPMVPDCWGVNIHFITPPPGQVEMIAKAGFKFIRMDMSWDWIEPEKGKYDFSAYDALVSELEAHGVRALFIINGGANHHYETMFPRTPKDWRAYANFAGACAAHYKGRNIIWEIWNEPDNQVWSPSPQPEQYVRMARLAARAIKAADPDAMIAGPAISQFWYPFLEPCLNAGILDFVDVLSIHPYWSAPVPEMVAAHWDKVRGLMAAKGKSTPMISGEWGYTTTDVSQEIQAQRLVRMCLTNLSCGIPLSIWYDWWDDGTDPKNREHNFGVIHGSKPKPAYIASQTMTSVLNGCRIVKRLDDGKSDMMALLFSGPKGYRIAAWTWGAPRSYTLPYAGPEATVVSLLGERTSIAVKDRKLTLELTESVVYVEMGKRLETQ